METLGLPAASGDADRRGRPGHFHLLRDGLELQVHPQRVARLHLALHRLSTPAEENRQIR